ncbi:hypothetical protein FQN55_001916 [Onygenales sp. PD_40]|nr:hypothetical protein FQN55_001916 [Onygenales sp. PD_40]KAK2773277.1 hypothetical protein FQN52_004567 [Onygenales sp. PD_12]KAK2807392.1 hypothetical protein FQN51_003218 [Onygenales sp. PD_10]
MASPISRPLTAGVYCPTVIFFEPSTEDLHIPHIKQHTTTLARAGLAGIVANGSNGEAVHLSRPERSAVTRATRAALDEAGFPQLPVIVGASEQSVRGTVQLCRDAKEDGGDYVLVMPPSFYRWAASTEVVCGFFEQVAEQSPLPVLIYNFPGAVAGVDIDSDAMGRLLGHGNIVGVKFTCGNVGKLARVARAVGEKGVNGEKMLFAGIADFFAPALSVGGHGVIAGGANVFPKTCVKVHQLFVEGKMEEARALQLELAEADWALTKLNFPGSKVILEHFHGYDGSPRQPVPRPTEEQVKNVLEELKPMIDVENSLPGK